MRIVDDEQSTVERVDEVILLVEKDNNNNKYKKKKNRRSNRHQSKQQHSPISVVNEELHNELSVSKTNTCSSPPTNQQESPELEITRALETTFSSMPVMHNTINEEHFANIQNDDTAIVFSKSCPPKPVVDASFPSQSCHVKQKIFPSYWSKEAVNKALEKGVIFKAFFHVNVHNRLEAYCRIDGLLTDVLVSGDVAQNRAVEGDIVAIKVDPLPLWTKLKGFNGIISNNSASTEVSNLPAELPTDNCKGKNKGAANCDYAQNKKDLIIENCSHSGSVPFPSEPPQLNGHTNNNFVDGECPGQDDVDTLGMLSSMISKFPSKRPTGRVVAILEKSSRRKSVVGFLDVRQWFYHRESYKKDRKKYKAPMSIIDHDHIQLIPTDPKLQKIIVLVKDLPNAIQKRLEDGDTTIEMELVGAEIYGWGEGSPFPQAHVLHVFGRADEMEPQINSILYENAIISSEFSPESLSCLPSVPWEVPPEELQSRTELRNLCIFTIDPSTATDLDDALSVERLSNGNFRIGVHIADVSYFVLPDSPLDEEAQIRSTSVYMLRSKIPMLPPLLSENVASLDPGVNRLAFSIFWELNDSGEVLDRWIGRTVIQSCCKLSYELAQEIIDGKINVESCSSLENGLPKLHGHFKWYDIIRSVKTLFEISKILKGKRFQSGALRLDCSKVGFLFDEYGIPYDSTFCQSKDSNFLVEEFMLLANRTAAEIISKVFPDSALLRRHPEPNLRKLKEFESFCFKHGFELDTSSSGQLQLSLEKIRKELKDDPVLFDILLSYATRPMQLAFYFCSGELKDNADKWGHYALAIPLYTHFTSPLRKYPDILVHRTLAAALEAEQNFNEGKKVNKRCFTGIYFDKDAVESSKGREMLDAAALKYKVPCTELLEAIAAHCNERRLATRHVKDACDKLYMWVMLNNKENVLSEARVLGLGPKFMSIYIQKLAIERRIYYDEVDGLMVEWLETTSTLILSLCTSSRRQFRRGSCRPLEDVALVIYPYDDVDTSAESVCECIGETRLCGAAADDADLTNSKSGVRPAVFPLIVHVLSTIPVVLYPIGGNGSGPLDIGARLYTSSYLR
ncbi:hypothetical protein ACFE04_025770 [Oxalis oulophora]